MQITMVKKQLENGEPCEKCAQTEEMLRRRELWSEIDEVVWAIEGDDQSPGNLLGARHGVKVAPFFVIVEDDGTERVITSPLKLIRKYFPDAKREAAAPARIDVNALADQYRAAEPAEILRFALERFGERAPIAFSGAEEIVLIDMATRLKLPFRVITLDTGRLHAETYAYLDDVRRRYGVAIDVYLPDAAALTTFVREKGPNSFYREGHRECCAIRKVAPLARALKGSEAWITGRRRDQSPATRADLEVIAEDPRHAGASGPLLKIDPLTHWTHEQVWDYIERYDVPYNPLHDQGYASIGCEPCTRAIGHGQAPRSGRWWWEEEGDKECGVHIGGDGI